MSYRESVVPSQQMITVLVEHGKVASRHLKATCGLTYGEFTLLLALCETNDAIPIEALSDFVMLRRRTVAGILLSLEDARLIEKAPCPADARIALCRLTAGGRAVASDARASLEDELAQAFTGSLPLDELDVFKRSIGASNNALRGHAVEAFHTADAEGAYWADYLVAWRSLIDRLAEKVALSTQLTLNEYRILRLLKESGPMILGDIAETLCMQMSGLSVYAKKLEQCRLVERAQHPFDGRSAVLRGTREGEYLSQKATDSLNEISRIWHSCLDDEAVNALNACYMRMYSNLRKYLENMTVIINS